MLTYIATDIVVLYLALYGLVIFLPWLVFVLMVRSLAITNTSMLLYY